MKLRDIWHTLVSFGDAVERLKSRDEMIERLIRREVKDIHWRLEMLENNPDERRRRNTVIEQGGFANPYRNGVPAKLDPAGKIGHSVAPAPERALNAAAFLADAIAKDEAPIVNSTCLTEEEKTRILKRMGRQTPAFKKSALRPRARTAADLYEQIGGYTVFAGLTRYETFVHISKEAYRAYKQNAQWRVQFFTGYGKHAIRKGKMFATRREAEQFAFDVLSIHEAECIKRKASTDWWNRVKIFEVIKR